MKKRHVICFLTAILLSLTAATTAFSAGTEKEQLLPDAYASANQLTEILPFSGTAEGENVPLCLSCHWDVQNCAPCECNQNYLVRLPMGTTATTTYKYNIYQCKYCLQKTEMPVSQGLPYPSDCYKREKKNGQRQPHVWVKIGHR